MAYASYKQNGLATYGVKEFTCDTIEDLPLLPTNCAPGSTALVIENSDVFILNSKRQWINLVSGQITDYTLPKWTGGEY